MARKYAQNTVVPISRTQGQLRELLIRYGADGFALGEKAGGLRLICFEHHGLNLRFTMQCPAKDSREERRMWRALWMIVKAKLESVESEISTFEEEFLGWVVQPNGRTIGEQWAPQLEHLDKVPPMLPGLGEGSTLLLEAKTE